MATIATPAGQALKRIWQEEGFAGQVADDADKALGSYDLAPGEAAALAADANLLSGEVSGFAQTKDFSLGMLQTPKVIGLALPGAKEALGGYCDHKNRRF